MVMTVLEAHVAPEKSSVLKQAYVGATEKLDTGIVQTFLVQGMADPAIWRIMTLWQSKEALDEMRRSGNTPAGVLMFRAAGAEPTLAVFNIAAQAKA